MTYSHISCLKINVFRAEVMYDRPADIFKETTLNIRHDLFARLAEKYDVFRPK